MRPDAISERPKTLFAVLCLAVGVVAGIIGAASKDLAENNRTQQSRDTGLEEEMPDVAPRVYVERVSTPSDVAPAADASAPARSKVAEAIGALAATERDLTRACDRLERLNDEALAILTD